MKQINNSIKAIVFIAIMILPFQENFAGNEQRAGQAGASELLINPWARSSGWAGANIAGIRGVESMFSNVAGLAFTEKTELIFSSTSPNKSIFLYTSEFSEKLFSKKNKKIIKKRVNFLIIFISLLFL